jgi:hypothetical protein
MTLIQLYKVYAVDQLMLPFVGDQSMDLSA